MSCSCARVATEKHSYVQVGLRSEDGGITTRIEAQVVRECESGVGLEWCEIDGQVDGQVWKLLDGDPLRSSREQDRKHVPEP
jgi:hypothetical protein